MQSLSIAPDFGFDFRFSLSFFFLLLLDEDGGDGVYEVRTSGGIRILVQGGPKCKTKLIYFKED